MSLSLWQMVGIGFDCWIGVGFIAGILATFEEYTKKLFVAMPFFRFVSFDFLLTFVFIISGPVALSKDYRRKVCQKTFSFLN